MSFPVIVIGLSAGGMQPLRKIIASFPADLGAAVLVVQHIPAHAKSNLAEILRQRSKIRVKQAEHGEVLEKNTVYTPTSDRHLLVENDHILITRGPKENRFRPAIDALFRSVAYHYGPRTIGVVLSGALNDGAAGMYTINRLGGHTIVQAPEEADFPDMPRSVVEYVNVDETLPTAEIATSLIELCRTYTHQHQSLVAMEDKERELIRLEIKIAQGKDALGNGILEQGHFTPLTCPDCNGAMTEIGHGPVIRYRCHTGHAHTAETLLTGIDDGVERNMWAAMRGMEEGVILLRAMAAHLEVQGEEERAQQLQLRAKRLKILSQRTKDAIQEVNLDTENMIS